MKLNFILKGPLIAWGIVMIIYMTITSHTDLKAWLISYQLESLY